jgi:uncharacterized protein (TIGR02594 family)
MTELPSWFVAARKELGTKELPENRGPAIRRYVSMAHCGAEGQPWCAIFANAMLESVGVPGTRSPLARSFEHHANFTRLSGPVPGCIVTFWRQSKNSGLGHVGFYNGEHSGRISTLGGNEADMVRIEDMNGSGATFGVSGYYWPKKDAAGNVIPLPTNIGPVKPMSASAAATGRVT